MLSEGESQPSENLRKAAQINAVHPVCHSDYLLIAVVLLFVNHREIRGPDILEIHKSTGLSFYPSGLLHLGATRLGQLPIGVNRPRQTGFFFAHLGHPA